MIPLEETEEHNVLRAGIYLIYKDFPFSNGQAQYFIENTCSHCKMREVCDSFNSLSNALHNERLSSYKDSNLWLAEKEKSPGNLRVICKAHMMTTRRKIKIRRDSKAL